MAAAFQNDAPTDLLWPVCQNDLALAQKEASYMVTMLSTAQTGEPASPVTDWSVQHITWLSQHSALNVLHTELQAFMKSGVSNIDQGESLKFIRAKFNQARNVITQQAASGPPDDSLARQVLDKLSVISQDLQAAEGASATYEQELAHDTFAECKSGTGSIKFANDN